MEENKMVNYLQNLDSGSLSEPKKITFNPEIMKQAFQFLNRKKNENKLSKKEKKKVNKIKKAKRRASNKSRKINRN